MMGDGNIVNGTFGEIHDSPAVVGGSWASRGYRIYLGLDTSLTKTGWAVVGVRFDRSPLLIEYGLIKSNGKLSDGERLRQIFEGIQTVLGRYPEIEQTIPREAGIVRFNLPTKQIFKAHGVTEFALDQFTVHDVNIMSVKAWARRVTGSPGKRNDKDMIAEAVRIYFNDPSIKLNKEGDEADAIAVAVFYLISQGFL